MDDPKLESDENTEEGANKKRRKHLIKDEEGDFGKSAEPADG